MIVVSPSYGRCPSCSKFIFFSKLSNAKNGKVCPNCGQAIQVHIGFYISSFLFFMIFLGTLVLHQPTIQSWLGVGNDTFYQVCVWIVFWVFYVFLRAFWGYENCSR